jgi:Mn2+/Fe2+ NRAMP family transporter
LGKADKKQFKVNIIEDLKVRPPWPIKNNKNEDFVMNKKNMLGMLFFMGLLGVVVSGMVVFQPGKKTVEAESADYVMGGFPVVPSER